MEPLLILMVLGLIGGLGLSILIARNRRASTYCGAMPHPITCCSTTI